MKPEEVFKGWSTAKWATSLCCSLLKYKRQIERQFSEKEDYLEFCQAIAGWKDIHLNDQQRTWSHETGERTAMALYDICHKFGVIQFMVGEGLIATEVAQETGDRCRGGAVRTRGGASSKPTISELKDQMQEIASLYAIPRHE